MVAESIRKLSPEDLSASATAQDIRSLDNLLRRIVGNHFTRMLDLGCGKGGLTVYVASYLGIPDVYGIDIDEDCLAKAKSRGINTYKNDVNGDRLPFENEFFDLVTSFGVLEHLIYFDNLLRESWRVLRRGGCFILAMPNLGSYLNRIALLLGYQPRDIEISMEILAGVLPFYPGRFHGHIHSAILRAVKSLMWHYGFHIVKVNSSAPYQQGRALLKVLDRVVSLFPSLSRRFITLGRKP